MTIVHVTIANCIRNFLRKATISVLIIQLPVDCWPSVIPSIANCLFLATGPCHLPIFFHSAIVFSSLFVDEIGSIFTQIALHFRNAFVTFGGVLAKQVLLPT